MSSSASVNVQNVELTPMRVTFNGVDLGGTEGGVKVSVKHDFADITVDQFGKTVIDSVLAGQSYSIKLILSETKLKDNWKVAFPSIKLVNSSGNKMMYFDAQVGDHLFDHAEALILHPLSKDDSDLAGDFKFFKAVAKSAVEVDYGSSKQTGLQVEFMVYPDSTSSPARFLVHGDPSIGLVAASIAAAVAGVNTGNGTVSGVSAGSKTVTETITLTCVGAATNAGAFKVVGSSTGIIGVATVGVAFTSNYVNLTINDGAADFVLGDSFTLAATSANYA